MADKLHTVAILMSLIEYLFAKPEYLIKIN